LSQDLAARATRPLSDELTEVGSQRGLFRGTWDSLRSVLQYRELLGLLVRREIRARYKNSVLGIVWSLMRPIVQLLIYYIALGQFLGAARSIPEFAVFVFTGLTIWGLFAEIIAGGTSSVVNNSGLIKKVFLPREIFPLSAVGSALFNFGIQFVILIAATVVSGSFPWHRDLLYVPLAIALVVVFATAIAFLLSALNVYLRDTQHIVDILVLVLFWVSPIVYSFTFVHARLQGALIEQVYLANPVTLASLAMQKGIWLAGSQDPTIYWPPHLGLRMLIALGVSLVLLWICQRVFARLQSNFAQEL
jgi:ABC-2 type transport system permease protein